MKIASITVFQVDLPLVEGQYNWSNNNSVSVFDSTVVAIENGMLRASGEAGLVVEPIPDVLGKPMLTIPPRGIDT